MDQSTELIARLVSGEEEKEREKNLKAVNLRIDFGTFASVKVLANMAGVTLTEMIDLVISSGLSNVRQSLNPENLDQWNQETARMIHEEARK